MQSFKRSDEGLFTIVIEEVNAKLIVSWKGDILEARKNVHKNELVECLYININDELLKIIEMHDASVTVTTENGIKYHFIIGVLVTSIALVILCTA